MQAVTMEPPPTVNVPVIDIHAPGHIQLDGTSQVVLYNDEVNSFDHVVHSLQDVFAHTHQIAEKITLDAHTNGKAIAAVEGHTEAVRHKGQLSSYGITAEVERI